jgi:uncharacterized protein (DUF1501 family)
MHHSETFVNQSRRDFLCSSASGIGLAALASMLQDPGLAAAEISPAEQNPLAPKAPHFAPKARRCIYIFMEGGPSQLDLFDPKPKLKQLDGQLIPQSLVKNLRYAFINKETARIMASPRTFKAHGECGMEMSDWLPNLAECVDDLALVRSMTTDAFNHHPGQLLMLSGATAFGSPSMGGWITYGLGSESQNLPGYVVLTSGRGTVGGASLWSNGFLPSTYQGVLLRNQGDPILALQNPAGLSRKMQRLGLDALRDLNRERYAKTHDPEITARIASYELAFRMQKHAPELIDLTRETRKTLRAYGVDQALKKPFATNLLLARRLVERGVRFVNVFHSHWDDHQNLEKNLKMNCDIVDQPIAALLRDLKKRGLLDTTLVVWGSEFGRTPMRENRAGHEKAPVGRDHHPNAFSIWMAGAGVKGGQVLGKTDELGFNVVEDRVHVNDLQATILHLFGLDHLKLTYRFKGRDFRLTNVGGKVVKKLLA